MSDYTVAEFTYTADGKRVEAVCASQSTGAGWLWFCTRRRGHDGMHMAGTGEEISAIWKNAEPAKHIGSGSR